MQNSDTFGDPSRENPGLDLSVDDMREMGYRAVDLVVQHLDDLGRIPPKGTMSEADVESWKVRQPSRQGRAWDEVLDELVQTVLADRLQLHHPRTLSHIPSPGNFVSAIADFVAAGMNVFNGTWMQNRGPLLVEQAVLKWMASAIGLPRDAGGLVTTGGSESNFLALAAALYHSREGDGALVYMSDQAHHSLLKALRVLRLPTDDLRLVPSDEQGALRLSELREMLESDRLTGRHIGCIVGTAGTTNTGAVDELSALSDLARRYGAHFHVDAALAGALAMTGRGAVEGLELADSLVVDPHKWLFQPYEAGCLLVRDPEFLASLFRVAPTYLEHSDESAPIDSVSLGMQQSRAFRALKIWMTLDVFGEERVARSITRGLELAQKARARLSSVEGWVVLNSSSTPVVACRYAPEIGLSLEDLDEVNQLIAEEQNERGRFYVGRSVFKERTILRLTPINPRTSGEEIEEVVHSMIRSAERLKVAIVDRRAA